MATSGKSGDWCPDWATHPGEHLEELLRTRRWTDEGLARTTGLPLDLIRGVIAGTRPVTPEMAQRLERVLDLKASVWINLQANWDAAQRRTEKTAAA